MSKCGHDKRIDKHYLCTPCLIKKEKYLWCVITKVPDEKDEGNQCDHLDMCGSDNPKDWIMVKVHVFTQGELLIVDPDYRRELGGDGRKPDKWFVEAEYFKAKDIKKAALRAVQATEEAEEASR